MKSFLLLTVVFFVMLEIDPQNKDWVNLQYYAASNYQLTNSFNNGKRVIFMGNSITEGWAGLHPEFFSKNNYIGRGIGGQTSSQFLVRFREDVINLKPAVVVINAATNDIAENTGPYNEDYTFGNIVSMVELARINKIKVILTTTLPATTFSWNPSIKDATVKIIALNTRLKKYAQENRILFVDYYSEMVIDENQSLNPAYTQDGVHPTSDGYDIMEKLIQTAIRKILK